MGGSQPEHRCGLSAGRLLLITNKLCFPRRKFCIFLYRQFAESKLPLEDVYAQGELPDCSCRREVRVSRDREHGFQRIVSNDFRGS